ncbi:uncharacterized protein MELLADRAFT_91159 [Melampsora larici-populina 98AG31]|uniref:Serine hydroxymethyltransferase-like domain-containing protein n=1 Tax=Melampsora larici-populina (strain 98AG31 / pathotype 3-4-7) TaxID=747676 RepID=F4RY10_MELLP|nr:uncharacterized protein MELLADRAFT_91159 [Melampsora larici-populina 98AG31]EGG02602.1 hypothetical protein MELLADRAFT_91159 [Melampsora larici-populina 98AG31]
MNQFLNKYGGNVLIHRLEILCQNRALEASRLDYEVWGGIFQPDSGRTAK